jgi:hypothetical protein
MRAASPLTETHTALIAAPATVAACASTHR